jgi:hypothetical protein
MKFTDILTESEIDRRKKKVKTIFKAFDSVVIYRSESGNYVEAQLPKEYKVIDVNSPLSVTDEGTIFVRVGNHLEDNRIKFIQHIEGKDIDDKNLEPTHYENYKHMLNMKLEPFSIRIVYVNRLGNFK